MEGERDGEREMEREREVILISCTEDSVKNNQYSFTLCSVISD